MARNTNPRCLFVIMTNPRRGFVFVLQLPGPGPGMDGIIGRKFRRASAVPTMPDVPIVSGSCRGRVGIKRPWRGRKAEKLPVLEFVSIPDRRGFTLE